MNWNHAEMDRWVERWHEIARHLPPDMLGSMCVAVDENYGFSFTGANGQVHWMGAADFHGPGAVSRILLSL